MTLLLRNPGIEYEYTALANKMQVKILKRSGKWKTPSDPPIQLQ